MIRIKNARILELDPPRYTEPCTIEIEGSRISAVRVDESAGGPGSERARAAPGATELEATELDAGGAIVMPGPVCGHHHVYSGLARALTATLGPMPDFVSVLKQLWWRLDRALTKEILEATAAVTALEAIQSGTTAVIDHHASPSYIEGSLSRLAEAFRAVGLRGVLCYETTDRHGVADMHAGVAENLRFANELSAEASGERGRNAEPLLAAAVGAHAPFTLSDESLAALAEAVAQTAGGLHIHVAEDRFDPSHGRLEYGSELIERLSDFGLLTEKAILVHGVHLSRDDIDRINDADATLAHNCRSNMNNAVGYNHNLPRYRRVMIGTDGIGSNMFEELRFAFFKHRDAGGPLGPGDFARFLAAGNTVLERYFNRPFGRIEPGYTADLVISDYRAPTPLDAENAAGHLIYGMHAGDVRTVIVNGRVVMREKSVDADLESIYRRAREAAAELWKRIDRLQP